MNVIASLSLKFNKFLHFTIEGNPVPTGADLWGISLGAMYGLVQGGASFSLPVPSFFTAQSRWILREFWVSTAIPGRGSVSELLELSLRR